MAKKTPFYLTAETFLEKIVKIPQTEEVRNRFYERFIRLKASEEKDIKVWRTFFEDYYKTVLSERINHIIDFLSKKEPSVQRFSDDRHRLKDLKNQVNGLETGYRDFVEYAEELSWLTDDINEKIALEYTYRNDLIKGIIIGAVVSAVVEILLHLIGLI